LYAGVGFHEAQGGREEGGTWEKEGTGFADFSFFIWMVEM